ARNVVLTSRASGVEIDGPSNGTAVISRGNTSSGQYVIELAGAKNVVINGLSLTGGQTGINVDANSASDGLTVENSVMYGNTYAGIEIDQGNANVTVANSAVHNNGSYGIYVSSAANAAIAGNDVYGNSVGISASANLPVAQRITVSGNRVHDNAGSNIYAYYN